LPAAQPIVAWMIRFMTPHRMAAWNFRSGLEVSARIGRASLRPADKAQGPGDVPYPPIGGIRLEARVTQTRDGMRSRFLLALMGFVLSSCDGAPSRNILGSYFPSWMVCALAGIAAAVIGRSILKATGLLEEVPAPLAVLLAVACAVTFGLWLLWLA
jgi:hypothetical protein